MHAPAPPSRASSDPRQPAESIFRKYYTETDSGLSPEGILKVLSAIVGIVSSVLFLSGGSCAGAAALVPSAATAALVCAALSALLYVAGVLNVPHYAPQAWLFIDIILSTVMGVLLLVMAVLIMSVCEMNNFIGYVLGPLGIVNAGMVTGSAVITYMSVMRLWDQSHASFELPRPPPLEQDV